MNLMESRILVTLAIIALLSQNVNLCVGAVLMFYRIKVNFIC
jgi:hypothetical protein